MHYAYDYRFYFLHCLSHELPLPFSCSAFPRQHSIHTPSILIKPTIPSSSIPSFLVVLILVLMHVYVFFCTGCYSLVHLSSFRRVTDVMDNDVFGGVCWSIYKDLLVTLNMKLHLFVTNVA